MESRQRKATCPNGSSLALQETSVRLRGRRTLTRNRKEAGSNQRSTYVDSG